MIIIVCLHILMIEIYNIDNIYQKYVRLALFLTIH